ncbi:MULTISPECIES: hypothetical protein [unclassified Streptomyces]|nr:MULTISPECIES: hypothetical protein [unclassified Streptomyces]WSC21632.1 hypothetical protein OIE60_19200 [Streptomyces sp. NBC_01766]WSV55592.1 hypothetical protein OG282_18890 [Streptomyces sp. NBC_01014]
MGDGSIGRRCPDSAVEVTVGFVFGLMNLGAGRGEQPSKPRMLE